MGDFAVSNSNGKTVFTFRTPSQQLTDYVKKIKIQNKIGTPHSNKKKRNKPRTAINDSGLFLFGRIVNVVMIYCRCTHAGEERRTWVRHILSGIIYI